MKPTARNSSAVVLYVEDDSGHRELLRSAAKSCQAKFGLALCDGFYDAVDYLGRQGKYAIVSDTRGRPLFCWIMRLERLKETDLVRWVRKQSALSTLPVVMFSGCTEVGVMAECYVAGADYYIQKPARAEDLLKVVRGLDACLEHNPPRVAALADVAADPTMDRQALTNALRDGLAENRALREQARVRLAKLDLTMAVRKEVLKAIPFKPKAGDGPKQPGRDYANRRFPFLNVHCNA